MRGDVGSELVVAATQVLDKGVTSGNDSQRPDRLDSAHRPQPRLQPAVIGFDPIVGVLLVDVPCGRDKFVEHPRIDRCTIRGDLARYRTTGQRPSEEARAALALRRSETSTSMTWPC